MEGAVRDVLPEAGAMRAPQEGISGRENSDVLPQPEENF